MKAVDRVHRWISLDHVLDRTRLEIRIHCAEPPTELAALLDAKEARGLAAALVRMAEQLAGEPTHRNGPQSRTRDPRQAGVAAMGNVKMNRVP